MNSVGTGASKSSACRPGRGLSLSHLNLDEVFRRGGPKFTLAAANATDRGALEMETLRDTGTDVFEIAL